ncbi:MAG TPA: hypothetical protein VM532_13345 [Burkholderiales bacterium]|nr:hypothetical protein [Burkholderiales bacterium]
MNNGDKENHNQAARRNYVIKQPAKVWRMARRWGRGLLDAIAVKINQRRVARASPNSADWKENNSSATRQNKVSKQPETKYKTRDLVNDQSLALTKRKYDVRKQLEEECGTRDLVNQQLRTLTNLLDRKDAELMAFLKEAERARQEMNRMINEFYNYKPLGEQDLEKMEGFLRIQAVRRTGGTLDDGAAIRGHEDRLSALQEREQHIIKKKNEQAALDNPRQWDTPALNPKAEDLRLAMKAQLARRPQRTREEAARRAREQAELSRVAITPERVQLERQRLADMHGMSQDSKIREQDREANERHLQKLADHDNRPLKMKLEEDKRLNSEQANLELERRLETGRVTPKDILTETNLRRAIAKEDVSLMLRQRHAAGPISHTQPQRLTNERLLARARHQKISAKLDQKRKGEFFVSGLPSSHEFGSDLAHRQALQEQQELRQRERKLLYRPVTSSPLKMSMEAAFDEQSETNPAIKMQDTVRQTQPPLVDAKEGLSAMLDKFPDPYVPAQSEDDLSSILKSFPEPGQARKGSTRVSRLSLSREAPTPPPNIPLPPLPPEGVRKSENASIAPRPPGIVTSGVTPLPSPPQSDKSYSPVSPQESLNNQPRLPIPPLEASNSFNSALPSPTKTPTHEVSDVALPLVDGLALPAESMQRELSGAGLRQEQPPQDLLSTLHQSATDAINERFPGLGNINLKGLQDIEVETKVRPFYQKEGVTLVERLDDKTRRMEPPQVVMLTDDDLKKTTFNLSALRERITKGDDTPITLKVRPVQEIVKGRSQTQSGPKI